MPKYATVAFDSAAELCRLYFSQAMQKHSNQVGMEMIRGMNHYPGATERLNMLARRVKNLKNKGTEVVFLSHEQIEKIYAKKGALDSEPAAVKGLPDMPGNRTPEEICRAADNILRVRYLNGKPAWIASREVLQGDTHWETKTRFWATRPELSNGILPASYDELVKLLTTRNLIESSNWRPPYVWILYGVFGIGKTASLETFPSPIRLFDPDRGNGRLVGKREKIDARLERLTTPSGKIIDITEYDVEECNEYPLFLNDLEVCF